MRYPILIYISIILLACESKPKAHNSTAKEANTQKLSLPANNPTDEPVWEKEARAVKALVSQVVDQWALSQQELDFETYSDLFANEFTGIKRAGNKKTEYRKIDWLKDRESMFTKGFNIQVSDVKIYPREEDCLVRLYQVWQSGNFIDKGVKELVLKQNKDGKWQITREEMIHSQLLKWVKGDYAVELEKDASFHQVYGPGEYVLENTYKGKYALQNVTFVEDPSLQLIGEVDLNKNPELEKWLGSTLAFADGSTDKIEKLKIRVAWSDLKVHFSDSEEMGVIELMEAGRKEEAISLYLDYGNYNLIGIGQKTEKKHDWAYYSPSGQYTKAETYAVFPMNGDSKEELMELTTFDSTFTQALEKAERYEPGLSSPFEGHIGEINCYNLFTKNKDLYLVLAGSLVVCGDYTVNYSALWERQGTSWLHVFSSLDSGAPYQFNNAVDFNGSGFPELFNEYFLGVFDGEKFHSGKFITLKVASMMCPC